MPDSVEVRLNGTHGVEMSRVHMCAIFNVKSATDRELFVSIDGKRVYIKSTSEQSNVQM